MPLKLRCGKKGKMQEVKIADLKLKKLGMVAYLKLKLDSEDWHGVQDAASDIRELEAMIRVLS